MPKEESESLMLNHTDLIDRLNDEDTINTEYNQLVELMNLAEEQGLSETKDFLDDYFENVFMKHAEKNEEEIIKLLEYNLKAYKEQFGEIDE